MSKVSSVVATYHTHTEADQAVKELQRGGVDLHKLSIMGKGYHTDEQVVGYYNTGDRMKYWGKVGAFWGGFWGLLFGSAFFLIPGIGPILAAGPVVAWIVAGLEGAVEVGALGAAARKAVTTTPTVRTAKPVGMTGTVWNNTSEIFRFTCGMIAVRRAHPVLSKEQFYTDAEIHWFSPKEDCPTGPTRKKNSLPV